MSVLHALLDCVTVARGECVTCCLLLRLLCLVMLACSTDPSTRSAARTFPARLATDQPQAHRLGQARIKPTVALASRYAAFLPQSQSASLVAHTKRAPRTPLVLLPPTKPDCLHQGLRSFLRLLTLGPRASGEDRGSRHPLCVSNSNARARSIQVGLLHGQANPLHACQPWWQQILSLWSTKCTLITCRVELGLAITDRFISNGHADWGQEEENAWTWALRCQVFAGKASKLSQTNQPGLSLRLLHATWARGGGWVAQLAWCIMCVGTLASGVSHSLLCA